MLYLFTQDSSRTLKLTIVFNEQHESRRVGITIRNGMKKHPLGMNESYTPSQPSQPNQAKQSYKTEKETNHNTIQKCRRIEEQEKKKNKLHHSLINYFLCCSRCISIRSSTTTTTATATTLRKPLFHPFLMLSIPKVDLEIVHGHTRAGRI